MVSGISGIGNVTDDYSHDPLDQLVRARYDLSGGTPVRDVQYSFDAVGNRTAVDDTGTNVSYTVNNLNQYTAIGGDSLTYDGNGNLATGAGLTLGYDAQGRLISAATATNAVSFIYDGRNRCVARTTVTATSGSTVWFVWGHEQSSHWGLLEERDADGDLVARYVHGEGIDEILRREAGASTVFYHHDALGSTTALTDASGALVEQYRYDVYGLPTIMDASGTDLGSRTSALGNRFMVTGREWLSDLGLYDYRNRAYSPVLGRWLQPDPIGFGGGDVNLYRYCGNSPVNHTDPDGLRVINRSDRTIPIIVNPMNPDGSQGKQKIYPLPPGGDTDVLLPGYDTDAIYPAEYQGEEKKVLKIVNGVTAEILPSGEVRFPWYNNPIRILDQFNRGGWKDDAFIDYWKWPRPTTGLDVLVHEEAHSARANAGIRTGNDQRAHDAANDAIDAYKKALLLKGAAREPVK